jgi:iron complex outermembrane receptor protein
MINSNRLILVLAASIATAALFAGPGAISIANAQDDDESDDSLRIDEIVVTSRKREESLFKIPVSVTAFSATDIENAGLEELPDLVSHTPGFHYAENSVGRGGRYNRRLIFRGMNPRTDRQTRQAATVFIDGAPTIGSEIGTTDNYERIEIIKGPQSAYFGRQTFSGAINAVTKKPGNEYQGKVSAEVGSWGKSDFGLQFEGALVADKLFFRLSGRDYSDDGEYTNPGDPNTRLGAESTTDAGLGLFFTPNDAFTAKLRVRQWKDEDGPSVAFAINQLDDFDLATCTPGGTSGTWAGGVWPCGTVPFIGRDRAGMDTTFTPGLQAHFNSVLNSPDLLFSDVPKNFGLERNAQENSLVMDWELSNGMTISSITAKHQNEYASFEDFDRRVTAGLGTCLPFFADPTLEGCSSNTFTFGLNASKTFFQELRLTSASDQSFRWMVGVSYTEIENRTQGSGKTGTGFSTAAASLGNIGFFEPETSAIFGSIAWDINDKFTLSAEARHQEDKVIEGTTRATAADTIFEDTFTSENPRVILDFHPNDETTMYLTYAEGSQPGQFNAPVAALAEGELAQLRVLENCGTASDFDCLIQVPEEEITSIELGVKSLFWNGRAQISAAVYMMDWENIVAANIVTIISTALPTDPGDPQNVQVNSLGGQADMSGLELEGTVLLSEHLQVDATISIVNSEIGVFESPDAGRMLGFRQIDGLDNEFSRYPGESGSLSVTYDGDFGADKNFFVRGDFIYSGPTWMTNANVSKTDSYSTVNLRTGVSTDDWRIEVYGTNLFDEEGYNAFQHFPDLAGISGARMIFGGFIPRQSFGVRASFFF